MPRQQKSESLPEGEGYVPGSPEPPKRKSLFAGQAKATAYGRGRLLVVIIVIVIVIIVIVIVFVFDAVTESLDYRFEMFETFGDVPQVLT